MLQYCKNSPKLKSFMKEHSTLSKNIKKNINVEKKFSDMIKSINIGNLKEKNGFKDVENIVENNDKNFDSRSEKQIERLIRMYDNSNQWEFKESINSDQQEQVNNNVKGLVKRFQSLEQREKNFSCFFGRKNENSKKQQRKIVPEKLFKFHSKTLNKCLQREWSKQEEEKVRMKVLKKLKTQTNDERIKNDLKKEIKDLMTQAVQKYELLHKQSQDEPKTSKEEDFLFMMKQKKYGRTEEKKEKKKNFSSSYQPRDENVPTTLKRNSRNMKKSYHIDVPKRKKTIVYRRIK